jgi:hypothetical protein
VPDVAQLSENNRSICGIDRAAATRIHGSSSFNAISRLRENCYPATDQYDNVMYYVVKSVAGRMTAA